MVSNEIAALNSAVFVHNRIFMCRLCVFHTPFNFPCFGFSFQSIKKSTPVAPSDRQRPPLTYEWPYDQRRTLLVCPSDRWRAPLTDGQPPWSDRGPLIDGKSLWPTVSHSDLLCERISDMWTLFFVKLAPCHWRLSMTFNDELPNGPRAGPPREFWGSREYSCSPKFLDGGASSHHASLSRHPWRKIGYYWPKLWANYSASIIGSCTTLVIWKIAVMMILKLSLGE